MKALIDAGESSIDKFLESENWENKISSVSSLLAAEKAEDFISSANYDKVKEMSGSFETLQLKKDTTDNKIKVINPSTGENIGEAPQCDKNDVDHAVKSSLNAFKEWKKIPARERGRLVELGARNLEERKGEIETLLSLDTGNALRTQAKPETAASIE